MISMIEIVKIDFQLTSPRNRTAADWPFACWTGDVYRCAAWPSQIQTTGRIEKTSGPSSTHRYPRTVMSSGSRVRKRVCRHDTICPLSNASTMMSPLIMSAVRVSEPVRISISDAWDRTKTRPIPSNVDQRFNCFPNETTKGNEKTFVGVSS
jgi:hypothetical protein